MTERPTNDFDDVIRAAANDYNRPGDAPRDRMWESIRAERARRAVPASRVERRRFWVPALAAAAVLILGIAIGRVYEHMTAGRYASRVAAGNTTPTLTPLAAPNARLTNDSLVASTPPATLDLAKEPRAALHAPRSTPEPRARRRAPRLSTESESMAYRLAVVEHLAGTDAMLTSFRDEAARGEVDAQITTWARNLLTTTRLLQASAGQQDPTMKRLLDDLELVLVQIAQYSNAGPHRAEELELIEHSIERRGVIGKLRTNLPARLAPSGT